MGDGNDNPFAMNVTPFISGMYDPNFQPFLYFGGFDEAMPLAAFAFESIEGEELGNVPIGSVGVVVPPQNEDWSTVSETPKKGPVVVPPKEDWSAVGGRDKVGSGHEQREQERAEARETDKTAFVEQAFEGGPSSGQGSIIECAATPPQELEGCTTVMLRNVPNKYSREMLVKQLNKEFIGRFDFLYLPIDFKNKCNVGYGFINFRTPAFCADFVSQFHGVDVRKCLPGLNSKKVVEVTAARVQGLVENVRRLKNSPVMNQLADHPEWMPLLFDEYGNDELFPEPDQAVPRVKPRGRGRDSLAW